MSFKKIALASASLGALVWAAPGVAQTNRAGASPAAPATETQAASPGTPDAGAPPAADTADTAQDIVVTGFRQSLASSRNLKRNAPQQLDAVVAEDIGKLPDLAVSDTAARIPGVQVIRRQGEAGQVLIRGLGEQFFNTLYNGREIFTAERRQVALQDFPSAGIAALEVYKTSTADQVDPGVVGLTNVRSRRPFDIKGFQVTGNVWGLHTVQSGRVTPNGNITVSDRWQTGVGEFGVLVNASYTQLKYLDSEPSNTDFLATPTINGTAVRFPDVQRLFYGSGDRKRPSVNAALQWRPSDSLEFYIEGLYQGFRNAIDDTLAAVPLYGGASYSNIVLRSGTNLVSSGTVTQAAGGPRIFSFRGGTYNKTDTYQVAAGGIYDNGPLRITADVARSKSTFRGSTESVDREFGINGYSVNFNNEVPQFSIYNFNAGDPSQYRFLGLYEESQLSKGHDWQARIDATYKLDGFIRSFQLGFRYTTRDAHREFGNRYAGGFNIPITQLPIDYQPVHPGFNNTDVQPFRTFLAPTYNSIRGNVRALRQFVINNGGNYTLDPVVAPTLFDADEKSYAGYAQANYNFNDVVDGTVGLRVVKTDTTVTGTANVGGVNRLISEGPSSTDYLPNASLRWRISQPVQLRLSYARTRTRPDFGQLNPSVTLGSPDPTRNNIRTGGGGNPNLKPFFSNNYDASLEYYFSPTGFASVAAFRRELTDFVQTRPNRYTDPVLGLVEITQPINAGRGKINGIEAQVSTFFDFGGVPDIVRSFGIQANYTYIDAKVQNPTDPRVNLTTLSYGPIQGVSKHSFNIVGLFERGPASLRLTYNKRTSYLDFQQFRGPTPFIAGNGDNDIFIQRGKPAGRLDLSANLRFTPNTTFFFDATNLTSRPAVFTFSSARGGAARAEYIRFLRYEEQTFSAGFRFSF